MLSSLEYEYEAIYKNDSVLGEFPLAILWKQIKENQIYFMRKCPILQDTIKLSKTREQSWGFR